MLTIQDKRACCGCQACHDACPAKCISMVADAEGFLYPKVNQADCLDCHLCEKICPQINGVTPKETDSPAACYAAFANDDDIRLQSSSGGIFSLLADAVLRKGGVVFGARFDDHFAVFHSFTETAAELSPFRGSKYAQSDLQGAYSQVQQFIKTGRPVLFSGTPCQIAGLRSYLRGKEYDNLFLVSIVCRGVPSPRIWKDYLGDISGKRLPTSVNMRNKDNGWSRYKLVIRREGQTLLDRQGTDTPFMRAFLMSLTLRPSCYSCHFRGNHGSDLTLGDYWSVERVHPDMADDKGASVVLVYSQKGRNLLDGLDVTLQETRYEDVLPDNPAIVSPPPEPADRARFWNDYRKHGVRTLKKYTSPGFMQKLWNVCSGFLRRSK